MRSKPGIDLILDSGAFSAWRKGTAIPLPDYHRYLKETEHPAIHPVNLDVIPGRFGVRPTIDQVQESAQAGWKNLLFLRKNGIEAMPVYHQGESFDWLGRMIAEGFQWIGISPANDCTPQMRRKWLDKVFERLCNSAGWPCIKAHAFGLTTIKLMLRYPWYSVDSSSWMIGAGYGTLIVPQYGSMEFRLGEPPLLISLSRKGGSSNHFSQMGPELQEHVQRYLETLGADLTILAKDYILRRRTYIAYFKAFMEQHTPRSFRPGVTSFFSDAAKSDAGYRLRRTLVYFGINLSRECYNLLNVAGVPYQILSYFYCKDLKPESLVNYVNTGEFL